MSHKYSEDWEPQDKATLKDQSKAFDNMREQCPVAHSNFLGWSVFRHRDIESILADPETFINKSRFPAIPNGLNPPEHNLWYSALVASFDKEPMARLEPRIRRLARQLINSGNVCCETELVDVLITPFVFKSLCAFLGWPVQQWKKLASWTQSNQELALYPDAVAGKALADNFASLVQDNLELHRAAINTRPLATAELLQTKVNDQYLDTETITTILRNWVAGHGTTADALGIVLWHVAQDAELQEHLRYAPALIPYAVEEILRVDGPLVDNRRTTTKEVELHGRTIPKDAILSLMWMSANRDPLAFKDADDCRLGRDNSASLVWGQGIHLCMGAPLARLEIQVVLKELLARTKRIELMDVQQPRKVYPSNGYAALHLRLKIRLNSSRRARLPTGN